MVLRRRARRSLAIPLFVLLAGALAAAALQTPEQFIGFRPGADHQLARWDTIVAYLRAAAAASDRIRVDYLGPSTDGHPFVAVVISSVDTIRHINRYKQISRRLYLQG